MVLPRLTSQWRENRPRQIGLSGTWCDLDLQLPHELNQIVLFLDSEFEFQDQVEELHRVFQCQKPTVMEIRRAVLDTAQRERLNRSISCFVFQEALDVEVVHLVIEIHRCRMAGRTLRFAKEQFLARKFGSRGLRWIEPAGKC